MARTKRNIISFICGVFILLFTTLCAQGQEEEPLIQTHFRTLGWNYRANDLFYAPVSGEDASIEIPQSFRSPEYSYAGDSIITFYRISRLPDGSVVRDAVCSVEVNQQVNQWLFLFVSNPESGEVRVFAMDDSLEGFPYGSSRYFNLTDRTLGVVFGKRKFKLEPRGSDIVSPDIDADTNVQLQILAIRNDELQDIYNAQWPQDLRVRYLIFIKESERRRGRVDIKAIPEYQRREPSL
jgi:hypothetical protein